MFVHSRKGYLTSYLAGNRHVKLSDREEMPYTQAFIHEVFRCASTAASSLPHVCSDDTEIQGQVIPAGKNDLELCCEV